MDHQGPPRGGHPADVAIEVRGLVKSFGSTRALDGISFDVARGQVLALLGANGAGKTTVVRILTTLSRADGGTAVVGGFDVAREPQRVRQVIGLTGQYASVDEALTGTENLRMIGELVGLPRRSAKARAAQLLTSFGLAEAAGRAARTYSGGMRRRLDLAASLVATPEVVFLDEPTTGLDPGARAAVWAAIAGLAASGTTVLLTSQYLEEVDALAAAVVVVDRGQVIASGSPTDLKRRVGGRRLVIRVERPEEAALAARVLAEITAAEPVVRGEVIAVTADDPALASRALAELSRVVDIAELELSLPSMDEVFVALTAAAPAPELTR